MNEDRSIRISGTAGSEHAVADPDSREGGAREFGGDLRGTSLD
jgi:hypothetical protein